MLLASTMCCDMVISFLVCSGMKRLARMKQHLYRTDENLSSYVQLIQVYKIIASHSLSNITKGSLLLSNKSQFEEILR